MKEKIFTGISFISAFVFFMSVFFLAIQSIGIDGTNKATILSGLLSMIGGLVGAFSAYLIARNQITTQLDLQDKKDRNRILLEIRIKKAEELLDVLNRTRIAYFNLQGSWTAVLMDYGNFIKRRLHEDTNYDEMKNEGLLNPLSEFRDIFINTYSECYRYRPHFNEIVEKIQSDHNEKFKDLTLNINSVMFRFTGADFIFPTYGELWRSVKEEVEDVNARFESVLTLIESQITEVENEVDQIISDFNK